MPTFKSVDAALSYVMKKANDALPYIGQELKELLRESIQMNVYSAYSPRVYERTGALGEGAIYEIYSNRVDIFFPSGLGHTSVTGRSVDVVEWVDKGHGGLFPMKATNFWSGFIIGAMAENTPKKALVSYLESQGFTVY